MGDLSWGLRKRTPSSVTFASCSRETIWKLESFDQLLALPYAMRTSGELTLHCLAHKSVDPLSKPDIKTAMTLHLPVKILCGHDCNLCAPPTASSVFCPGFSPLCSVSSVVVRLSSRPACASWWFVQVVCIVQAQPTARLFKLLRRQTLE